MSKAKISYSQSGEDIIVAYIFDAMQIKTRHYLDIGTNDPVHLNNTYLFYSQGFSGVCVEPDPDLCKIISKERPRDKVIQVGIGDKKEKLPFYMMEPHTLNTFSKKEAAAYQEHYPWTSVRKVTKINLIPVNDVLKKYFKKGLDFLSIDTEGLDQEIIENIDFKKHRPVVICVETAVYKDKKTLKKNTGIINFLRKQNYFVYADTFVNAILVDYEAWLSSNGSILEGY
jgi:FkbM family methyltransferase